MKKAILIMVLIAAMCIGCTGKENKAIGDKSSKYQFDAADSTNWDKEKNSPEWLALYSSSLYKEMLEGTVTCEEGLEAAKEMATAEAAEQLGGMETEFRQGIEATRESLKNNDGDKIKAFHFSECIKDPDYEGRYTIYRIQEMESGTLYYFKQDFIQESGQWKVYGNNVENPFYLS